ncbi:hypothetical protein VTK26DRAFT_2570 [Humicola hyalothermophila]
MAIIITVCRTCLSQVERALGGAYFQPTGKVNMLGEREYEVAIASDPAKSSRGSLFMQAWNALPGYKNGNHYICPHTLEYQKFAGGRR